MKKLTGAVLIVGPPAAHVDIAYATGFRSLDPVVYARQRRWQYLIVPRMELARAVRLSCESSNRVSYRTVVLTQDDLPLESDKHRPEDCALALVRKLKFDHVTVPTDFPHGLALRLAQEGIHVSVAEEPLFPERAIKSPWEIAQIARAQRAAARALRAAVEFLASCSVNAAGVLTHHNRRVRAHDVRFLIERVLLENGCRVVETIVAGGRQSADPHECGKGLLRAHQPIVIDVFPQLAREGYWGDLTRTVVKGSAPRQLRAMYAAVRAAQRVALGMIRDGTECAAIHARVREELERRGFVSAVRNGRAVGFIHGTGHGVGLAVHEAPAIAENRERLNVGNVVTVEPGLYYPGIGGVRHEDTVVVTRTGWRYLARCRVPFVV